MKDQSTMKIVNGDKVWCNEQGKRHRTDGPAVEWADGYKEWWLNGDRHRKDGPAIERANGSKEWFLNGKLHRTDGPAIEWANGDKSWWVNDQRHRTDGPAVERANGDKEWYLNDEELTEAEFKRMEKMTDASEALALYAAQGWQDISTAPDGKRVIVIVPWVMDKGFYEPEIAYRNGDYWFYGCQERMMSKPTHWMPLPAAPIIPNDEGDKQ